VRTGRGPFGNLIAVAVTNGADAKRDNPLFYVCRNGLIGCRQSEAIIQELRACTE